MNGFSPSPMDLHNVTLSRELQVCICLTFHITFIVSVVTFARGRFSLRIVFVTQIHHEMFVFGDIAVSAGHGGGGGRKLPQHLGQEEEN